VWKCEAEILRRKETVDTRRERFETEELSDSLQGLKCSLRFMGSAFYGWVK
jgi:hypothetical protein